MQTRQCSAIEIFLSVGEKTAPKLTSTQLEYFCNIRVVIEKKILGMAKSIPAESTSRMKESTSFLVVQLNPQSRSRMTRMNAVDSCLSSNLRQVAHPFYSFPNLAIARPRCSVV